MSVNNDEERHFKDNSEKEGIDNFQGNIVKNNVEDEMKKSYLDYAMSVIVSRALPDVKDGLKPVHRRILYGMHGLGLTKNKPYKKCARIVGEVLGKYHPHGDSAVYDSLVRMAQSFSMRYTLVDGQGNFGSIDGDGPAAMRYTEARMTKITEDILADIDKNTVNMVDNFDGSEKEPIVLPSKIPLLLSNGTTGIAVGMATNIPPHNLSEILDAFISLVENPEIEDSEIMEKVKGPDFPTGGLILGSKGIDLAQKTGKGKFKVRAKTHIENKANKISIIVDEIPYMTGKADIIVEIADCVKNKVIEGISDVRDESDREGMRISIELKKDASEDIILNQLFKHTRLQTTIGMNMLCLVDNIPKTLTLREILNHFLKHRLDVITKRTQFELDKAEKQAHILLGLKVAIENIDKTVKIVKESNSTRLAKESLKSNFEIDEIQAQAILDMKLQRLTSMERDKIIKDYDNLVETIKDLKEILSSEKRKRDIIVKESKEIIEKYSNDRRTQIIEGIEEDINMEDLIEKEENVVTVTHSGYIKRMPLNTYRSQGRGGKGVIGTGMKDEDFVENMFVASTHDYLLCFTNFGKVHWIKVYNIPEGSRQSKGKAIINLLPLETSKGEQVATIIPVSEFKEGKNLVLVTRKGIIKKSLLKDYSRPRQGGVKGVILDEDDELIKAMMTDGNKEIVIATSNGLASRFDENDVRVSGRVTRGVRGISLKNDKVIGAIVVQTGKDILTITENGFGKRTPSSDYRLIKRGGKGVINIKTSSRNGKVSGILNVDEDDEVMLISKEGIVIRTRASEVSKVGRNTQGVRIMKVSNQDKVVSCTKIAQDEVKEEKE
ncbi:MAG: DNA gyrase subunit A [Nanobdellota archaeon]